MINILGWLGDPTLRLLYEKPARPFILENGLLLFENRPNQLQKITQAPNDAPIKANGSDIFSDVWLQISKNSAKKI
jgi:hypothetical protein